MWSIPGPICAVIQLIYLCRYYYTLWRWYFKLDIDNHALYSAQTFLALWAAGTNIIICIIFMAHFPKLESYSYPITGFRQMFIPVLSFLRRKLFSLDATADNITQLIIIKCMLLVSIKCYVAATLYYVVGIAWPTMSIFALFSGNMVIERYTTMYQSIFVIIPSIITRLIYIGDYVDAYFQVIMLGLGLIYLCMVHRHYIARNDYEPHKESLPYFIITEMLIICISIFIAIQTNQIMIFSAAIMFHFSLSILFYDMVYSKHSRKYYQFITDVDEDDDELMMDKCFAFIEAVKLNSSSNQQFIKLYDYVKHQQSMDEKMKYIDNLYSNTSITKWQIIYVAMLYLSPIYMWLVGGYSKLSWNECKFIAILIFIYFTSLKKGIALLMYTDNVKLSTLSYFIATRIKIAISKSNTILPELVDVEKCYASLVYTKSLNNIFPTLPMEIAMIILKYLDFEEEGVETQQDLDDKKNQ